MDKSNTPNDESWFRYDRSREAPWWVWAFVVGYSSGVITLLWSLP